MPSLPPEIITDILSRLPVKPLLRFRCVSKPWCSLIDSKAFINLHLQQSMIANSNRSIIVDSSNLFNVDIDSFELLDIGDTDFFYTHSVVNSCDGIVLVVVDDLLLWNPSTRKCKKLPPAPMEPKRMGVDLVLEHNSFGYDSKNDDYKVVQVAQASSGPDNKCLLSETMIYSLKSNSWKRVDDFPYMLPRSKVWSAYLNDAFHTVVDDCKCYNSIMAFDLSTAKHYEVPKPDHLKRENLCLATVDVMGGCLTASVFRKDKSNDIWVMKEYGVKESWIKLFSFYPPISAPCLVLCPLAYSKNGDEVLFNYDGMCLNWYDLRKKTVTIASVRGLSAAFSDLAGPGYLAPMFHAVFCVGSLVSLDSPDESGGTEKQDGRDIKNKKEIKKKNKRDDFLSVGFKLVL